MPPPPLDPSVAAHGTATPPKEGVRELEKKPQAPKEKRTELRSLRMTPSEAAAFDAKVAGRNRSEVVRALIFSTEIPEPKNKVIVKIKRKQMTAAEAERFRLLAAFGNNLNQIARQANAGHCGEDILATLIALERAIKKGQP